MRIETRIIVIELTLDDASQIKDEIILLKNNLSQLTEFVTNKTYSDTFSVDYPVLNQLLNTIKA